MERGGGWWLEKGHVDEEIEEHCMGSITQCE